MANVSVSTPDGALNYVCSEDDRLLYAGLRSGIALPYECGSGTCGKCRAVVVAGTVRDLWPAAPAEQLLKRTRNEVLLCQSAACGDVTIEVRSALRADRGTRDSPQQMTGVMSLVRRLTDDVIEFVLAIERPLMFEAGQFVLVEFPGIEGFRAYSMVNYDRPASSLRLILRRKPGGEVSKWLFDADRTGETVRIFGPLGKATFDSAVVGDVLCIAGGSGIAGMMSIIRRAISVGHFARARGDVFFGVRKPSDLFYAEELSAFRREVSDGLSVTVALSETPTSLDLSAKYPLLDFDSGLVHDAAMRTMQGKFANTTAFLAGPPPAVDAGLRNLITVARIPVSRIRYDRFT